MMKFRYESCAFSLFAFSLAALSADPATPEKSPKPMGVTTQPTGVITPPMGPKVSHGANFFMTADFIYWKSTTDGYDFATSGQAIVGADGLTPIDPPEEGRTQFPDFDFQAGLKLGGGVKFAHDGWDLYVNYTWLCPKTTSSSISDPSGHMFSFDPYFGSTTISKAHNRFKQLFNTVDLELGRNFFLSKYLTLRPYFGLKAMWLDQHMRSTFTVFNDADNGINAADKLLASGSITELVHKFKLKSVGIGIRGGITPVWYFIKDFGLYGNLAVSGMWTYYKNRGSTTYSGTISGTSERVVRSFHTVTPVVELGLGLTYDTTFYNDTYGFSLSGGWEEQIWIGFNGGSPRGNLSFQGLTCKAGFEF